MPATNPALGHNNPPAPTPYEAVKSRIEDLLVEARNWADGAKVENAEQADTIARVIEQLRLAERAADDARKDEVKPLDDQRDTIQARYNVYIAPLKNKQPGKIPLAIASLKATPAPWLQKLDDERREREEAARAEAAEKARIAAAALMAAQASDLSAQEDVGDLLKQADIAAAQARRAANDKAQARGDGRAIGLRSYFSPVMVDARLALKHYAATNPEAVKAALQALAAADVAAGKRQIPGFNIIEERRVA